MQCKLWKKQDKPLKREGKLRKGKNIYHDSKLGPNVAKVWIAAELVTEHIPIPIRVPHVNP
jgi:hypothetical protein